MATTLKHIYFFLFLHFSLFFFISLCLSPSLLHYFNCCRLRRTYWSSTQSCHDKCEVFDYHFYFSSNNRRRIFFWTVFYSKCIGERKEKKVRQGQVFAYSRWSNRWLYNNSCLRFVKRETKWIDFINATSWILSGSIFVSYSSIHRTDK